MTSRAQLEEQIFDAPDDDAPYIVYGDWLQAQGDPRGRLTATQLARTASPDDPELAATEAALIEEIGDPVVDVEPVPSVEWHAGFWHTLRVGGFGWSARPPTPEHIATLLAAPSAKFLRGLVSDGLLTNAAVAPLSSRSACSRSCES